MEDPKEDRSVRKKYSGEKGEEHSQVKNPEPSLYAAQVHLFWLVPVFVAIHCLADSYEQEEHDRDDDVEGVDVFVEGQNSEVVEVPENVKNNHEDNSESSEDVEFNKSL